MNESLNRQIRALRFAIPPILVYVLAIVILEFGGLGFSGLESAIKHQSGSTTPISAILAANQYRVIWLSVVLMFCTTALSVLAVSIAMMHSSLSKKGFVVFLAVGIVLGLLGVIHLWVSGTTDSEVGMIFRSTYLGISSALCCTDANLAAIAFLVSLVNVLAAIVPPFLALAGCSLTVLQSGNLANDPRQFLCRRMSLLKTMTNLGSAMLVVGALHQLVWLRWPMVFTADAELHKAIGEWALSVTLYCGTVFTLMIAALYIPCSMALKKDSGVILRISMPDLTDAEIESWLEGHGFSAAPLQQIPQIISALAPMLAGPIGSVISGLGSQFG